jgi:NhaP-type Na+/H+ and K+/H+ antiporter
MHEQFDHSSGSSAGEHLRREAKVMLLVEASLSDGLAVITVSSLMDLAAGGNASPRGVAWALISSLVLASACGSLARMLWSYLLPVLSEERFWHVLTFGAVLLVYSGVHFLQGNELVAIPVFGLTLSNFPGIR